MRMKKFEFIEHTADIGVRVYGKTLEELFLNSACALLGLLAETPEKGDKKKKIQLETETLEDLLVNWLNELISLLFADKFLPRSFEIKITTEDNLKKLQAEFEGIDFDPYVNKINMEIKAATYHNLKIKQEKDRFKAEIIFDI